MMKNPIEKNEIFLKIITLCGKYLKRVEWKQLLGTELMMNGCPMLESITVRGLGVYDIDLDLIRRYQRNLTTLSISNGARMNKSLGEIFKINTKLKTVMLRSLQWFQCTSCSNLNPDTLQQLHLYEIDLPPQPSMLRTSFRHVSFMIDYFICTMGKNSLGTNEYESSANLARVHETL